MKEIPITLEGLPEDDIKEAERLVRCVENTLNDICCEAQGTVSANENTQQKPTQNYEK